mmetsp:Transcript_55793/g.155540  ORF Transcript_55793/g.155540 Transcript_55793/m.155540 type:complete len:225 (-) Transcript_55793:881-1555(-)
MSATSPRTSVAKAGASSCCAPAAMTSVGASAPTRLARMSLSNCALCHQHWPLRHADTPAWKPASAGSAPPLRITCNSCTALAHSSPFPTALKTESIAKMPGSGPRDRISSSSPAVQRQCPPFSQAPSTAQHETMSHEMARDRISMGINSARSHCMHRSQLVMTEFATTVSGSTAAPRIAEKCQDDATHFRPLMHAAIACAHTIIVSSTFVWRSSCNNSTDKSQR